MRRLRGLVARGWKAAADTAFRAWRESSITAATILIPTRGWRGEVIERAKPVLAGELAKRLRTKLGRWQDGDLVYGTAKELELLTLHDVLMQIDEIADKSVYGRIVKPQEVNRRHVEKLTETTLAAYERLCDEVPHVSGIAYALYQAIVETADHRKGRGSVESTVIGSRAQEKVRAWEILTWLN